jgi:5-carboxymethyl-2-hydroxymuconate isomerase
LPHCIIEHSSNFEGKVKELINAVHKGSLATGIFDERDIKTRALSFENYQTGTSKTPFIHVSSKILVGRNAKQKSALSDSILLHIKNLNLGSCSLTVEIIDIDKDSYAKINT